MIRLIRFIVSLFKKEELESIVPGQTMEFKDGHRV